AERRCSARRSAKSPGGSSIVTNTINDSIASMTTITMKRWSTNFATRVSQSSETAGPAVSQACQSQVERGEPLPSLHLFKRTELPAAALVAGRHVLLVPLIGPVRIGPVVF